MKTLEIYVSGRVQGVSYRFYTVKKAKQYNLTGSARNLYDGRVKVVATGAETDLNHFLEELRQGPVLANVTEINVNEIPLEEYETFRIVY
jgi:acylphosphatase